MSELMAMVELLRVGQECRVNEEQVDRIPELKVASPIVRRPQETTESDRGEPTGRLQGSLGKQEEELLH